MRDQQQPSTGEEFTAAEHETFDAWTAPEPPADFAARVMTRAAPDEETRIGGRRPWVAVAAAGIAALIAVGGIRLLSAGGEAANGRHHSLTRMTLSLGKRAVVVSEPETELEWTIAADGTADVKQSSGNAFYRVEPGGKFVVHTPEGEVRVAGTCFRVEVEDMSLIHAGLVGAVAGAAITGTVLVSVYEGKVVTSSQLGTLAVEAGESARLAAARPPEPLAPRMPGPKTSAAPRALGESIEDSKSTIAPESMTSAQLAASHRALAKEANTLRQEVAALRAKLDQADTKPREVKTYDLSHEELVQMADHCELRWDMQPLRGSGGESVPADLVEKLHLSDDEIQTVQRVMKADHLRVVKELAALYTEITGDSSVGSVAPMSMFEEINDKAPKGEISRVFQKLARERAGLEPAPQDLKGTSAWERAYRLVTSAGDKLEAGIAAELGPAVAHSVRDLHQGFGAKSRNQVGCPKG